MDTESTDATERPPLVRYFSRLGATHDAAETLAEEFGTIESFLDASFQDRLEAVVGTRQATAVVNEFNSFEHFRDWASYAQIAGLEGVGRASASRITEAFISSYLPPRDFLRAEDLAEKMGLYDPDRVQPNSAQAELGDWSAIRTDGGQSSTDTEQAEEADETNGKED